jgi:signal transduction histidine kinase
VIFASLARIWWEERGDPGTILRAGAWFVRLMSLVLVGLLTFAGPPTEAGGEATQTVVYALACFGVMCWLASDFWRRRPDHVLVSCCLGLVVVAGCLGASAGGTGDCLIALAVGALVAAGSELALAPVLGLAAVGLLAVEVGAVVFGQGLGTLLGFPLLLVVGTLVGRNRASFRVQAEQAAVLLAQQEQLQAEQRWADVLDERARIAREIHDVLAHSLGALSIQIQTVHALFADFNEPERALEALVTAQRMAADGLTETRRAVHALRTDTLPLQEELARAAAEHAEVHRVSVRYVTEGAARPVPPDATVALLRTARESLVNAAKHAPGSTIGIHLGYAPDGVRMTVASELTEKEDPEPDESGVAQDPMAPAVLRTVDGGYGLTGMRERLLLLRGTLDVGIRGHEWIVTAELPLAPHPTTERADR